VSRRSLNFDRIVFVFLAAAAQVVIATFVLFYKAAAAVLVGGFQFINSRKMSRKQWRASPGRPHVSSQPSFQQDTGSWIPNTGHGLIQLHKSTERWWQKPLVAWNGTVLPAELVILSLEQRDNEAGAWLNSRSSTTGVIDLRKSPDGTYTAVRAQLPTFVSDALRSLYIDTGLKKGMPDLVIWNYVTRSIRLVEVKCPHWDRPSPEQRYFFAAARNRGISVAVAEWEFCE
jgi:hypothetical protein